MPSAVQNAAATARRLDLAGWLLGIWGAAISGGAASASAALGTIVLDKKDANAHHLLAIAAICFGLPAVVSMMKYLALHPAPTYVPVALVVEQPESEGK